MNILIFTFGSRGDVQPFVALGQGLKKFGFAVTVCTCSRFESFVSDQGLQYAFASNDLMDLMDSAEGRDAMERSWNLLGVVRIAIKLMKDAKAINRELLNDSWSAALAVKPDMVIFHPKALGGVSIAEKLRIPVVKGALMHRSRIGNMVIDCPTDDLLREANFWAAALGCELPADASADSEFIQLKTPEGEVQVILQAVNRTAGIHLDIETDSIEAEVARLEQLGAAIVVRRKGWVVMEAPSGHRFCVGVPYRSGFEDGANWWC